MTELIKGGLEELRDYHSRLAGQFHANEIKPLAMVESLWRRGMYAPCGLYEDGALRAYMLLARGEREGVWLLDYFAVPPECQDRGFGGLGLTMLSESFGDETLLLETEEPMTAPDARERETCERRLRFYLERCLCRDTGVRVRLFGSDYRILLASGPMLSKADMRDELDAIYRSIIPPALYNENVAYFDTFGGAHG